MARNYEVTAVNETDSVSAFMGFFCTLRVRIRHDFKTVSDVDARQSIARINYLV